MDASPSFFELLTLSCALAWRNQGASGLEAVTLELEIPLTAALSPSGGERETTIHASVHSPDSEFSVTVRRDAGGQRRKR